jgi:hypothetical protein
MDPNLAHGFCQIHRTLPTGHEVYRIVSSILQAKGLHVTDGTYKADQ